MKPVEVFAVVIRTVGLIVSLFASAMLFFALLNLILGGPANGGGMIIVVWADIAGRPVTSSRCSTTARVCVSHRKSPGAITRYSAARAYSP